MKRKVVLARIKMKVGKNQPSMKDILSRKQARSGVTQSPKTINASGTRQEESRWKAQPRDGSIALVRGVINPIVKGISSGRF